MVFKIIWPEVKDLTVEQVHTQHADAVANGEVGEPEGTMTVAEKALELHDAGLITLAKRQRRD